MVILLKRAAVFILLFMVLFSVGFLMIQHDYSAKSKIVINREIPDEFPIAVFLTDTSGYAYQIQHVYYRDLEEFRNSHHNISFLVPEAFRPLFIEEDTLVWQFENLLQTPQWLSEKPYYAALLVESDSGQTQNIKFTCTWDNDFINIGWYSATDQEFIPRYYQHYYLQGMTLRVLLRAFLISLVLTIIIFITYIKIRKTKN